MTETQLPETQLETYRQAAINVVSDVFSTMLATAAAQAAGPAGAAGAHTVVGAVYFAGEWRGAVLLQCEPPQAFEFTSLSMGIRKPDGVNDDVRDAIGEIAHMIAGNLKSALPANTALSMPSVVEGAGFTLKVLGGNSSLPIYFSSDRGPFSLTLVQVEEG
jgi:chemotaxis protein CheX